MMLTAFVGPVGALPCDRQTNANPPSIISHVSVNVTGPAGPIGPPLASPSKVQVPTKYDSRWNSGPGLGMAGCAQALDATASTIANAKQMCRMVSPRADC